MFDRIEVALYENIYRTICKNESLVVFFVVEPIQTMSLQIEIKLWINLIRNKSSRFHLTLVFCLLSVINKYSLKTAQEHILLSLHLKKWRYYFLNSSLFRLQTFSQLHNFLPIVTSVKMLNSQLFLGVEEYHILSPFLIS